MADKHVGNSQICDLASLRGVLRVCEMELVLLGTRGPQVSIQSQALSEAIFCSGELDFDFRGRFVLPSDWCVIGFFHQATQGGWCHGMPLEAGMAFTVWPEGICEFLLRGTAQVTLVVLPTARLQQRLGAMLPLTLERSTRQMALFSTSDTPEGVALQAGFERIRELVMGPPAYDDASPNQDIDLDQLLNHHVLGGLSAAPEDRPQCSRRHRAHYLIVQRVEQFMRANMRHDIYSQEMCAVAGVSERALRYAFEDMLGISPNRYLSMLRLCTACRSLSLSDASRRSVKSVALSCGLWDLSRFADNYRRVFGELPRDTLMRAPSSEPMTGA